MNVEIAKETALHQATNWLVKLEANEVSSDTKAQFFAWLDASELNQQAYIEIETLSKKLNVASRLSPNEASSIRQWLRVAFGKRGQLLTLLSVLAIATVLVLLNQPPRSLIESEYATAVGERLDFRLEDGSLLQLNTDSAVSVRMESSRRLLILNRGEAYFDIAPDADRPLVVKTRGGMVQVLGTQFNIRQTDSDSVVSVVEGLVAVAAQRGESRIENLNFQPELTLAANQQTRLNASHPVAPAIDIDSSIAVAWRQGQLIYEGNTLTEVIADLNRYFPGTIRLDDFSLGDLEMVGVINLQNQKATLAALEATFGVEVVQVSEGLTLIRAGD